MTSLVKLAGRRTVAPITTTLGIGSLIGMGAKSVYDKHKKQKKIRKALKFIRANENANLRQQQLRTNSALKTNLGLAGAGHLTSMLINKQNQNAMRPIIIQPGQRGF